MTGLLRSRIDASKTITLNQRKVHTQKKKKIKEIERSTWRHLPQERWLLHALNTKEVVSIDMEFPAQRDKN